MCLGPDGELEGQISINELLIAMGEPPVESLVTDEEDRSLQSAP